MNMPLSSILAILFENLRPLLWPLAVILAVEMLVFWRLARGTRPLPVGRGLSLAAVFGLAAAVATFLLAPGLTQADFRALSGWLDWGFLAFISLAAGVVATLIAWPLAMWWRQRA